MPTDARIADFLTGAGLAEARLAPLAGDASARRYARVAGRILMDAPAQKGEDVRPFLDIAARLAAQGLSVPHIEASDTDTGLILMEDLGDALYSKVTRADPAQETALYLAATDAIAAMQATPCTDLPDYPTQMPDLAGLAIDWYAPESAALRDDLVAAMAQALDRLGAPRVFVHRDYHADNLIWLPDRAGVARVGLLDFQDAMQGPPDYDLASLLHDARRVVRPDTIRACLDRWQHITGRTPEDVAQGFAICSVQRGLRILGVFSRLCIRDGKTHYPDFIPRTWALLQQDLRHPSLAELAGLVARALPDPTADRLASIRARAGAGQP